MTTPSVPPMVLAIPMPAHWRDFVALTKPRVMSLAIFTALCGMLAAPGSINPILGFTAVLAIALGAGASGALNQWYEVDVDSVMRRTAGRPLPAGRMERSSALHFGVGLGVFSVLLLGIATNWLAAGILAASILYYLLVYTAWLKPRTPQNIVIGGAAGAFPPLIGWAAATGSLAPLPWLLFALIFLWTPPHFWALSLFVKTDYANAGIPMLPVVSGERVTRHHVGLYSVPMAASAVAPWLLGYAGPAYGLAAVALSLLFLLLAGHVALRTTRPDDGMRPERRLFAFSILYLFLLFGAVVADRWIMT